MVSGLFFAPGTGPSRVGHRPSQPWHAPPPRRPELSEKLGPWAMGHAPSQQLKGSFRIFKARAECLYWISR